MMLYMEILDGASALVARMQGSWSKYLSEELLPRAKNGDGEMCLCDTLALHAEALDAPVAAANGALHTMADDLRPQILSRIKG